MSAKPAFSRSFLRLAITGVLFYASYGLANAVSAWRAPVPEIVFAWEAAMPFWPWAIFPYWGLNGLYALGFFLCETDGVQRRYMAQLWLAQAVAVSGFLLFPLQISWIKPEVGGLAGQLFTSLAQFDAPYNQAPSLHIMLALIVGRFYWYRLAPRWRAPAAPRARRPPPLRTAPAPRCRASPPAAWRPAAAAVRCLGLLFDWELPALDQQALEQVFS